MCTGLILPPIFPAIKMTKLPHLLCIANKGYAAFESGLPRQSPYQKRDNLSKARREHWLGGWDEAERDSRRPIPREPVPARPHWSKHNSIKNP